MAKPTPQGMKTNFKTRVCYPVIGCRKSQDGKYCKHQGNKEKCDDCIPNHHTYSNFEKES